MCLLSGLCPIRKLHDAGIPVGLGTDISGGYTASLLEEMRLAIIMSKCLKMKDATYEPLTYREVFYFATLGGANALAIGDKVGNFKVGKQFDALHIDLHIDSPVHVLPDEDTLDMIEKFIMLGDDRNIVQVFVDGKDVKLTLQPLLT